MLSDKISGIFTIGKDYINHPDQLVVNPKTNIIYASGGHDVNGTLVKDCDSQDRNSLSEDNASDYDCAHDVLFVINGSNGKLMDREIFLYGEYEDGKKRWRR